MDIARRTKRLTIVEGCDGAGKSTFAKQFAAETDAQYVHFGPCKGVRKSLGRFYVDAMLPALVGARDVVFDRAWFSEQLYGAAYRNGEDRLGDAGRRMLERLAFRCGAVVIYCRPPWSTVKKNFLARTNDEYLPNTKILKQVYDGYIRQRTDLPSYIYDYEKMDPPSPQQLDAYRTPRHPAELQSAGNANGRIVLISDACPNLNDHDPWYRWPFGTFVPRTYSQRLTAALDAANIPESLILWVTCDQLSQLPPQTVSAFFPPHATRIALGRTASNYLWNHSIKHLSCEHPATYFRKYGWRSTLYPLPQMIHKILTEGLTHG